MLSPEMLEQLITPCHESLAHASALTCYWTLREDFTINNMYRRIKTILKGVMIARPLGI